MFVDRGWRGHGVGERLVAAVLESARAAGALRVVLEVVEGNAVAERLYRRCGFVRTGRSVPLPHRPDLLEQEMVIAIKVSPEEKSQPSDQPEPPAGCRTGCD